MNEIKTSDVKISFNGIELTPFCKSQSLKDAKTVFSTLREDFQIKQKFQEDKK